MSVKRPHAPAEAPPVPATPAPNRVSSRDLLGEAATLVIEHRGEHYVLRATARGRLILTK